MRRYFGIFVLVVLMSCGFAHGETIFAPGGIGYWDPGINARITALGGAGIAHFDTLYVHSNNPATWRSTGATRFTIGVDIERTSAKSPTGTDNSDEYSFPGATIALPIYKSLGIGLVYQILTDHEYLVLSRSQLQASPNDTVDFYDVVERNDGDGGLSRFGVMTGFGIKKLAIGVGMDVYLGKLDDLWTRSYNDSNIDSSGQVLRREMSGIGFRVGAIYSLNSKINVAGLVELPVSVKADATRRIEGGASFTEEGGMEFTVPLAVTLGATYTKKRWRFLGDVSMRAWENSTRDWGEFDTSRKYTDTFGIAAGIERLPSRGALDPWLQKWMYRAGFHYTQHYLEINDNIVPEIGFSIGFGKPLKTGAGAVDFTFGYTSRGTSAKNNISENIYYFQMGWTTWEKWFVRRER
ncbi:hypothetical protein K8I28_02235 [bacterium]|nr:hypothetical protein [bacterium]